MEIVRHIEILVADEQKESVLDVLDGEDVDYVLTDETGNRDETSLVSFPLPTQAVGGILDVLHEAGLDEDTYTVVSSVETAISEHSDQLEERYAERVVDEAERARADLVDARFGTFDVVSVILDHSDPVHLHIASRMRSEHGDALPAGADERFEELEALFEDIHVARQYFKTVFVQQELADLSRLLLYPGFVALLGGGFVVLTYGNLVESSLGRPVLSLVVAATVTALFAPFTVLLVYVLRIATVARRTAADFGPFILQREIPDRDGEEV